MSEDAPALIRIVLADEVTNGQIVVPLEAYLDFTLQLDADLEQLEKRFVAFQVAGTLMLRRGSAKPDQGWNHGKPK